MNLLDSISNLYLIFSRYEVNPKMDYCSHCKEEADVKLITSKPLKELTPKDLSYYSFSAISTIGNVSDFKYFLPRIIEIISFELDEFDVDPEIIFNKFVYSNISTWPVDEVDALKKYTNALWENLFETYVSFDKNIFEIDSIIYCIAQCDENIISYLEYWLNLNNVISKMYFFDFLYSNLGTIIKKKKLSNSFWDNSSEAMNSVVSWIRENYTKFDVESIFGLVSENDQYRLVHVSNDLVVYKSDVT